MKGLRGVPITWSDPIHIRGIFVLCLQILLSPHVGLLWNIVCNESFVNHISSN